MTGAAEAAPDSAPASAPQAASETPREPAQEPEPEPAPQRLSQWADWRWLLSDLDEVYRRSSAGGSAIIRSHQKRVRDALGRLMQSNPQFIPRQPESRPVTAHLPRALDLAANGPLASMGRTLSRVAPELAWEYGYDRMPGALANRYAFAEIAGPRGPVASNEVILGLVLFSPGAVYPQHAHEGIEESYVSLAGAWSENDAAVYAPGSLILNRPGQHHRITVGDKAPCLLAYAWIGGADRLSAPGMRFGKPPRKA